jgi:hypothetical protein
LCYRDFLRRHRPNSNEAAAANEDSHENLLPSIASRKVTVEQGGDTSTVVIRNLTLRDLIRFATEIAAGMEFLSNKKVAYF